MIKKLIYLIILLLDLALIFIGSIDWKIGIGLFAGIVILHTLTKKYFKL
jgi:hypothetical protein